MPNISLRIIRHMPGENLFVQGNLRVSRWDLLILWEFDRWTQWNFDHTLAPPQLLRDLHPHILFPTRGSNCQWSMDSLAGAHTLEEKWLEDTVSLMNNYSLCMLICILTLHIVTHSLRCLCTVKSQCTFLVLLIELLKLKHQCSTLSHIKNLKYLQCVIIP